MRDNDQLNFYTGAITQARVRVVIVNYNAGSLLTRCVSAVLQCDQLVDVVVVDNASDDGSVTHLRKIFDGAARLHIINNSSNLGFAKAVNKGIAGIDSDYVLVLNPDCIIAPNTLSRTIECMDQRADVGMAGCRILNANGSEQAACRRRLPTPWRAVARVFHLNKVFQRNERFFALDCGNEPLPTQPVEVEAISGAYMFVRRTAIEQVGLLDEGYFLHCEDLDWCMRFRQADFKVLFVPDVEVVHYKGTCSKDRPLFVLWHKHKGMIRYYHKFFRHQYPSILMPIMFLGVWVRFGMLAAAATLRQLITVLQIQAKRV